MPEHTVAGSADTRKLELLQDTGRWPLVDPLPSYGRGRELPGRRYMSFIQGDGISDVIITGDLLSHRSLGVILHFADAAARRRRSASSLLQQRGDKVWWFFQMLFEHATASCVVIEEETWFDSDSSSNVCIEDAHISTGDDLVAIKSGWDEYGIAYGRPSSGITIRRLTGSSPFSGVAIGSETSGGVENVLVENVNLHDTGIGIHIKTNVGRGGFIRNITVVNVSMNKVRKGIRIAGDVGDHPDDYFDRRAIPAVDGVTIKNVWGVDVQQPGSIQGIKNSPFTRICLSNVKLWGVAKRSAPWKCVDVSGAALGVLSGSASMAATPPPSKRRRTNPSEGGAAEGSPGKEGAPLVVLAHGAGAPSTSEWMLR
ncbi:hypothetical protein BHE74_00035887 [Ensete ventricosum]|nr:hypothetical protein GW17_00049336 [Ensete ventricosum]RWW57331.1 hypothetical protein BHE74_00035887 [Ensete ventricosum]